MSDGWAKNWEVVKKELRLYGDILDEQWHRVKREPDWRRKIHVLSGLEPDAHRTLPRTLTYLNRARWVVIGLLGLGFGAWWWLA